MGKNAPTGVAAAGTPPTGDQANVVVSDVLSGVGPGLPAQLFGQCNAFFYATYNSALTTTNGSNAASVASAGNIAAGQAVNSVNVPPGTTWATFAGVSGTLALPKTTLQGRLSSNGQISGLSVTAGLLGATVTGPNVPNGATVTAILQAAVPGVSTGAVQLSANPTAIAANIDLQNFVFALSTQAITTGVDANAIFTGAGITFTATMQIERSFDGGSTWLPCNIGGGGSLADYSAGTPVSLTFGEPERGMLYRVNCLAYTSGTINYRLSATGAAAMSLALGSPV